MDGYLADPESNSLFNPELISFEQMASNPCLVLLGEPGIGKSTCLEAEREVVERRVREAGESVIHVDLRSVASEAILIRRLFENQDFDAWIKGSNNLFLFLDSLDEALIRVETLGDFLADEMKRLPIARLKLRIACRTAEWPRTFEEGLRGLFGKEHVDIYELAPLRKTDVQSAATSEGIGSAKFLRHLADKNAQPLAIKPVTLRFLLNIFKGNGQFPRSQVELYRDGLRLLCTEVNPSRVDKKRTGNLSVTHRLTIAGRIAAATVFGNRYAIWTRADMGDVPSECIAIQDLCGGREAGDGDGVEVDEESIREVLSTGLFTARGLDQMGWAHQTYAEFLAAWYLVERRVDSEKIYGLIFHPGADHKRLVPQLHETAAWLAGMSTPVFDAILATDPEVLLRSDITALDSQQRAKVVVALLESYEAEKLRGRDDSNLYAKLSNPTLESVLKVYIGDPTRNENARRVALHIAGACELRSIEPDLISVVLDQTEREPVRIAAGYALIALGPSPLREKLKPLAKGLAGEDPSDALKGIGLQLIWPGYISAPELFELLTQPKKGNYYGGTYYGFLFGDLAPHLAVGDLPTALEWIKAACEGDGMSYSFNALADAILEKAWESINSQGVAEAFGLAVLVRIRRHHHIIARDRDSGVSREWKEAADKRHRILEAIMPHLSGNRFDTFWLFDGQMGLVTNDDLPWLLQKLKASTTDTELEGWSERIFDAFHRDRTKYLDEILSVCLDVSALAKTFSGWLKPVELDSEVARKSREEYQEHKKWTEPKPPAVPSRFDTVEEVQKVLNAFESGPLDPFWHLDQKLAINPSEPYYHVSIDWEKTHGWKVISPEVKLRVLSAARRFILEYVTDVRRYLGTDTTHFPSHAGCAALKLLLCIDPEFIKGIEAPVWERWAYAIIAYLRPEQNQKDPEGDLVRLAYQMAPRQTLDALALLLESDIQRHGHNFHSDRAEACWDSRVAKIYLERAKRSDLKIEAWDQVMSLLVSRGSEDAEALLRSYLAPSIPAEGFERQKAVVAFRILFEKGKDHAWDLIWTIMESDPELAKAGFLTHAFRMDWDVTSSGNLAALEMAKLYVWLSRTFPQAEDSEWNSGIMTPRDKTGDFRDSVLRVIQNTGSQESCQAVRWISSQLPHLDWMKWVILSAEEITRRRTWNPPSAKEVLELVQRQEAYRIANEEQLAALVLRALNKIDESLQDVTPSAIELWNEKKRTKFWPKDEKDLSDWIVRRLNSELRGRGIVLNREVEIRRGQGGKGEETDILISAFSRGTNREAIDIISVVVEVKGCWNKELLTALDSQLVGRYLKENACHTGLYVVGWFGCKQWDEGDYRKKATPKKSLEDLKMTLNDQAKALSKDGSKIFSFVLNAALRPDLKKT
jgi:hypothetical protein